MAQEWQEVLEKRNRTSKTKRLHEDGQPTNKFSLDATIGPMHYRDARGDYQDIHTDLVPSTRSITGFGNPAYEMVENEYEMFVLGQLNSGVPLVRCVSKNTDYYVQFAAHNLVWTNDLDQIELIATPVTKSTGVSGGQAKWLDAYGIGFDLRYTAGAGRMQKWLDIASPLPVPPQFIIDGGNPVIEIAEILEFHKDLEVWVNGQKWDKKSDVSTAAEIEFRSPDGQVQFVFPVAVGYQEGEGKGIVGKLYLKKSGAKLYVTARFPWAWLQSAIYPIHLDQTIDKQVAAGADDGRRYTGTDGFSASAASGYLGYYNDPTLLHLHGFARWDGVTIEGTIGANSYIQCYPDGLGALTPELKVYGVDEDNPPAPTTAAQFDADPLTDAAVDWDGLWTRYAWNTSPSLSSIFQELVDTYTISNEAVMVQIKNDHAGTGNEYNAFDMYEYTGNAKGPKLHIEYTAGGGVEVAPSPASAVQAGVDPTVVLGSLSIAPAVSSAVQSGADPTTVLGSISLIPSALTAVGAGVAPTIILGSISITPSASSGVGSRVNPSVVQSSLTIVPVASAAVGAIVNPTVVLGSITIVVTPSSVVSGAVDPSVILGSIALTPTASSGVGDGAAPTVHFGSTTTAPSAASGVGAVVDPTTIQGSITLQPSPASAIGDKNNPTVVLGSITIVTTAGEVIVTVTGPAVVISGLPTTAAAAGGWHWGWREEN